MSLGSITRGCGKRIAGGIYAEVPTSASGMPLEHFIVDAPLVVNVDALGVSPVGVTLIERAGTWHVLDWVGSQHYPNVADFVEEVRRFGASRRLPRTLEFDKLTPGSRLLVMHARAHIDNHRAYYDRTDWDCPKRIVEHGIVYNDAEIPRPPQECCAGLWWRDIDTDIPGAHVERIMPAFTYSAKGRPEGIEPRYCPAIFMALPIHNLAFVRDGVDPDNQRRSEDAARASGLAVTLEDE